MRPPRSRPQSSSPRRRARRRALRASQLRQVRRRQQGLRKRVEPTGSDARERLVVANAPIVVDIDHVLAHARLVWADERVALDWLTTPNAHLDGVRPVEWIRRHGTAEVVEALRAEASGAYA